MRQLEGLIGSVIGLLGLVLAVPDHSTLSRWVKALEVPRAQPHRGSRPLHLLVDSTGQRRAAEVDIAVHAPYRMVKLGRPNYIRNARPQTGLGLLPPLSSSMQNAGS